MSALPQPKIAIRTTERPTREQMMMMMAYAAASRCSCARRHAVGALIVTPDLTNVIAIGYNGPARGVDAPCTRTPDVAGSCTCVHAEANALIKSAYVSSVLVTTTTPCADCARLILNSRVERILYHESYRDAAGVDILLTAGIPMKQVDLWTEMAPWWNTVGDTGAAARVEAAVGNATRA